MLSQGSQHPAAARKPFDPPSPRALLAGIAPPLLLLSPASKQRQQHFFFWPLVSWMITFAPAPAAAVVAGSRLLISVNISCTLSPVLADVSTKIALISSAYVCAVSLETSLLSSRSHLLPAMAITMFSGPSDCSSCTQFCSVLNDGCTRIRGTMSAASQPRAAFAAVGAGGGDVPPA